MDGHAQRTDPPIAVAETLLSVANIEVRYSDAILALRGVSLHVDRGEIVALLGPNGAGKTTTLRAIGNLLAAERGRLTAGHISLDGVSTAGLAPGALVARGMVQVLEGRHCFAQLTVEENLVTGALVRRPSARVLAAELERVYGYFPRLRDKRRLRAGQVSGGEQQMTALGRALMGRPRLLVLDEPSMGLAPRIIEDIFAVVNQLNAEEGIGFLIAEQNAATALRHAHRACFMQAGRVVRSESAEQLRQHDDMSEFYFGAAPEGAARAGRLPAASWVDG
jgi:branched-chain amino acid transport system ATP-binding protein